MHTQMLDLVLHWKCIFFSVDATVDSKISAQECYLFCFCFLKSLTVLKPIKYTDMGM